jgi:hypothetical protein
VQYSLVCYDSCLHSIYEGMPCEAWHTSTQR